MKVRKHDNPSRFQIYSYFNSKVNPKVPVFQKAVFNYLGFTIHQVQNEEYGEHGDFLNDICQTVRDTKFIIVFDIDCIPLHENWINQLLQDLKEPRTLAGAAQTANHLLDARNLYVSPFFFGISTDYLRELDYPNLKMTTDMDGGQNLTEAVKANGGTIRYWWPTEIEEEKWSLYHPEHTVFGPGTTYNHSIYHAFFSLHNMSDRFFRKCREVLPWYYLALQWKKLK